jgi:hypothetical protein
LKNHQNVNGLFFKPVAVSVTGSLFWDGEHRFPNNVGPEGLRPTNLGDSSDQAAGGALIQEQLQDR